VRKIKINGIDGTGKRERHFYLQKSVSSLLQTLINVSLYRSKTQVKLF
jgi:hypothetical protein